MASASQTADRCSTTAEAASPASFHPSNAAMSTGSRRDGTSSNSSKEPPSVWGGSPAYAAVPARRPASGSAALDFPVVTSTAATRVGLPAAVLWDMDGTLIDSEPYWIAEEHALVESFGGTWTDAHAHALIGNPLEVSAQYIL